MSDNPKTVCGLPLNKLAEPEPLELAAIVARWSSHKQAYFLMDLAGQLENCCGGQSEKQICLIAFMLNECEERECDGKASSLISRLAWFLENQPQKEKSNVG